MERTNVLFDFLAENAHEVIKQITTASFVNGRLDAPTHFLTTKHAIGHTGFVIDRFNDIRSVIQTLNPKEDSQDFYQRKKNTQERKTEGWFSILVERKHPGFLGFKDAGYEGNPVSLDKIQEMVCVYVGMGYRGVLHYNFGHLRRDGETWDTLANITVWLNGVTGGTPDRHPFSITLKTYYEKGEELIRPVLNYCHSNLGEAHQPVDF